MSDLQQALAISGSIFAVMMLTQYGRRDFTFHKWAYPLISVAAFGFFYLKDAPGASVDWLVYLAGAMIGAAAGVVAARTTGVGRDENGTAFTVCGKGFAATWLVMSVVRIAFIVAVEHVDSFRNAFGTFMISHQISFDTVPPFFVLMALSMVVVRLAVVMVRIRRTSPTETLSVMVPATL
jgi:hypothetical protein